VTEDRLNGWTEDEWLACTEPWLMPSVCTNLGRPASERKLRLFACACAAQITDHLRDERYRRAIAVGERFADGGADDRELATTREVVQGAFRDAAPEPLSPEEHAIHAAWFTLAETGRVCLAAVDRSASCLGAGKRAEQARQAAVFRDIVGNPFRPVTADPRWLTSTATSLAQAVYSERAFDRLPILADALEDAGCGDPVLLAHCRGEGPHVRGCWAVDLVLEKG
jgi:hypothetical protein